MIPQDTFVLLKNLSLAGITLFISILVGKLVSKFLKSFKDEIEGFLGNLGVGKVITGFIIKGTEYTIYFIGILLSLSQFGFSAYLLQLLMFLTVLATIITFLWSLRKLLVNASAGIYLARIKQIERGVEVKFNSRQGKIIERGLLSTIIKSEEEKIIIPNSLLIDKEIKRLD